VVDSDEHSKTNTTLDALASLHPAFVKEDTLTAGNASGINKGRRGGRPDEHRGSRQARYRAPGLGEYQRALASQVRGRRHR